MADKYTLGALNDLRDSAARLDQLISYIEADTREARKIKVGSEPGLYEGSNMSVAQAKQHMSTLPTIKAADLKKVFGELNGSGVLADLARRIDGPRDFTSFASEMILQILREAAPRTPSLPTSRMALRAGVELLISKISGGSSLENALSELDQTATFNLTEFNGLFADSTAAAAALELMGIRDNQLVDASTSSEINVANPYKGNVFIFLQPLSLAYVEWLDRKTDRERAGRNEKIKFIANQFAQRAVEVSLAEMPAGPKVLMPLAIGGANEDKVRAAFDRYTDKDLDKTYDYYKKVYEKVSAKGSGVGEIAVEPYIKSLLEQIKSLKSEIQRLPYPSAATRPFLQALDHIASNKVLEAPVSKLDNAAKMVIAELSLAEMLGLVDTTPALGSPFDATKTLDKAVNDELTALGTDYVNEFMSRLGGSGNLSGDQKELQGLLVPTDFTLNSLSSSDALLVPAHTSLISIVNLMRKAYEEQTTLSLLGAGSSAPEMVETPTLELTDDFKKQVKQALLNTVSSAFNWISTSGISGAAKSVYQNVMTQYFQLLTKDRTLDAAVLFGTTTPAIAAFNNIPGSFYLDIASGDQVRLNSFVGDRRLRDILMDRLDREIRFNNLSRRDAAKLKGLVGQGLEYVDAAIASIIIQIAESGVRIRKNPAGRPFMDMIKAPTTVGQQVGVGAGAMVLDHAVTSGLNSAIAPTSGSMTAHALNYGPSVAMLGGAAWAHTQGNEGLRNALAGGAVAQIGLRMLASNMRFGEGAVAKGLQYVYNAPAYALGDASLGYCAAFPFAPTAADEKTSKEILKICKMNKPCDAAAIGIQGFLAGLEVTTVEGDVVNIAINAKGGPDLATILAMPESTTEEKAAKMLKLGPVAATLLSVAGAFAGTACFIQEHGIEFTASAGKFAPSAAIPEATRTACANAVKAAMNEALGLIEATKGLTADKLIEAATAASVAAAMATAALEATNGNGSTPSTGRTVLGNYIQMPGSNIKGLYQEQDAMLYTNPVRTVTAQPGQAQLDAAIKAAQVLTPSQIRSEGYGDLAHSVVIFVDPRVARACEDNGMGMDLGKSRMNPSKHLVTFDVEGDVGNMGIMNENQFNVPQGVLSHKQPISHSTTPLVARDGGAFGGGVFKPRF